MATQTAKAARQALLKAIKATLTAHIAVSNVGTVVNCILAEVADADVNRAISAYARAVRREK